MTSHEVTVLPALYVPPRSRGTPVPRRYEDTRPVVVQSYTHKSILDLGHDFHSRLLHEYEQKTQKDIKAAETAVWEQAETLKQEAVNDAVKQCKVEHEKYVRKLNKTHEKNLKEELIRLSQKMERERSEAVERTQQQCAVEQRAAIQRTEREWEQRLLQAVEAARCEERQAAADQARKVAENHRRAMAVMQQTLQREKSDALSELSNRKNLERVSAVTAAREEEKRKAEEKISHLKGLYEQQIGILQSTIKDQKHLTSDLRRQTSELSQQRAQTEAELRQTRDEFTAFIRMVRPFNNSESAFVVPPAQTINEHPGEDPERAKTV